MTFVIVFIPAAKRLKILYFIEKVIFKQKFYSYVYNMGHLFIFFHFLFLFVNIAWIHHIHHL